MEKGCGDSTYINGTSIDVFPLSIKSQLFAAFRFTKLIPPCEGEAPLSENNKGIYL